MARSISTKFGKVTCLGHPDLFK